MSDSAQPFWPYEERFEVLLSEAIDVEGRALWWEECARLAGATIVHAERVGTGRHFILSMSSLIVFEHRLVLLSCAPSGVLPAADYLLDVLTPHRPSHATLERRTPEGRFRGAWPKDSTECVALSREWRFSSRASPPKTLVVLMHDLRRPCSLEHAERAARECFPELTFSGAKFAGEGFSFNAVGGKSYVTMHYTANVYASLELSVENWKSTTAFVDEMREACRAEVVRERWSGE